MPIFFKASERGADKSAPVPVTPQQYKIDETYSTSGYHQLSSPLFTGTTIKEFRRKTTFFRPPGAGLCWIYVCRPVVPRYRSIAFVVNLRRRVVELLTATLCLEHVQKRSMYNCFIVFFPFSFPYRASRSRFIFLWKRK